MDILDLTPRQLNRAAAIKQRIAALTDELTKLLGATGNGRSTQRRRRISAAGRRRIAAAQRARWVKLRNGKSQKSAGRTSKKTAAVAEAVRSANKADSPAKKTRNKAQKRST